ncbi:MAG: 50S ribosomal protein L35 [Ignavibacteriae bacterium HGW-Ignavibacteriae-1]|jgi:large subunit ribosomal protein L35|nr:MAG: 50S ribosomal protein L35 [Ignavibacteriae bacterium HGW-Ignavibacteriae-1]
MPKMKSNGSAKKRFKIASSGTIKRRKAYGSHILTKKSSKRKRNLKQSAVICDVDVRSVKRLLAKA